MDAKAREDAAFRHVINDHQAHGLAGLATVALARLKIDQGSADQAIPLLVQWLATEANKRSVERVRLEETLAEAYFRDAKFSEAQELYFQLAGVDPLNRARFLYGAAICALRSGDRPHYESAIHELGSSPNNQTLLGNLEIARATIEARSGQTGADTTLRHFLASFPDHPQTPEAHLLLAEIPFTELPPNQAEPGKEHREDSSSRPEMLQENRRLNYFVLAD